MEKDAIKKDLDTLRHTASHIMAQAVKRLFKDVKLAIGPSIQDGFYYDFETPEPFTTENMEAIENEMKKIVKENLRLETFSLPRSEAIEFFKNQGEPYKIELIEGLDEGSDPTFYKQGEFTDLCAGPHMDYTARVKAFKLLSVAGAYWRGDEKNKMLSRIYGTAFFTKEELETYLAQLEEAKKRDHRKIGREMKLFTLFDEGPGFPFWLHKGLVLRNNLLDYWRKIHYREGYQEIATPIMLTSELWHTSGHYENYRETMYASVIDETDYFIKPMNCPGGMLVYNMELHSYKEFPLRVAEIGLDHRHEKSGTLHGLFRVRCFWQDDAHIFMTKDQITDEIINVIEIFEEIYSAFGLTYHMELSTRPEKCIGTIEEWEQATDALRLAMEKKGCEYIVNEGDGAFYGPKIDFHIKDSMGRTWQCGTIQLDMQMPERFDLTYIGADGGKHRPVMIHRALFGSIERFIGIITEHTAGWFPFWLTPVQAMVIPITDRHHEAAQNVLNEVKKAGYRAEIDTRSEKMGYKIREAQMQRIPYMLVIGDKEAESGEVSVRSREKGDEGAKTLPQLFEEWGKLLLI